MVQFYFILSHFQVTQRIALTTGVNGIACAPETCNDSFKTIGDLVVHGTTDLVVYRIGIYGFALSVTCAGYIDGLASQRGDIRSKEGGSTRYAIEYLTDIDGGLIAIGIDTIVVWIRSPVAGNKIVRDPVRAVHIAIISRQPILCLDEFGIDLECKFVADLLGIADVPVMETSRVAVALIGVHQAFFHLEGKSLILERALAVDQQGTVHTTRAIKRRGCTLKEFHIIYIEFGQAYDRAHGEVQTGGLVVHTVYDLVEAEITATCETAGGHRLEGKTGGDHVDPLQVRDQVVVVCCRSIFQCRTGNTLDRYGRFQDTCRQTCGGYHHFITEGCAGRERYGFHGAGCSDLHFFHSVADGSKYDSDGKLGRSRHRQAEITVFVGKGSCVGSFDADGDRAGRLF